jgi:hypothetical protein
LACTALRKTEKIDSLGPGEAAERAARGGEGPTANSLKFLL